MKKSNVFICLLMCLTSIVSSHAAVVTIDGLKYSTGVTDNTAKVIGYEAGIVAANIPEKVTVDDVEYTVTEIGYDAFKEWSSLESLIISDSEIELTVGYRKYSSGGYSYTASLASSCKSLKYVYIGRNMKPSSILHPLLERSTVEHVDIGDKVTRINDNEFAYSKLRSLTIPGNVKTVGQGAFGSCDSLKSMRFEYSPEALAIKYVSSKIEHLYIDRNIDCSFSESKKLREVIFGDNVTEIPDKKFDACPNIQTMRLSKNLKSIGESAFAGAKSIREIQCGAAAPPVVASDAFATELYGVTTLLVPDASQDAYAKAEIWRNFMKVDVFNPESHEIGGINYVLDAETRTAVVTYQKRNNLENYAGLVNVVIPETVEYHDVTYTIVAVGPEAFNYSWGLKSVSLPATVTAVGDLAFGYCTSLRTIKLPDDVTEIGNEAFTGCSALASVDMGQSLTSIGDYAFFGCTGLCEVTVPETVTSIGESAFMGIHWMENVYAEAYTPSDAPVSAFSSNAYKNAILHVPACSLELYKNHPTWSKFLNMASDATTGIDDVASDGREPRAYAADGALEFVGVDDDTEVCVYSTSGVRVYSGVAQRIALSPGLYVVTIGDKTTKVKI